MERDLFERWKKLATEDKDLTLDLLAIENNEQEIVEHFYKELEFGTGGLRGIMGAGSNRMNIYTIRKVTQGFANYLLENFSEPSVAIAYDSRIKSDLFAKEAAKVLAANKIKVFIFSTLMPTPVLSFAVREIGCSGGIVVTASHNPSKYNGYKVYGPDGCQCTSKAADDIQAQINSVDCFDDVKLDETLAESYIRTVDHKVYQDFLAAVNSQALQPDKKNHEKLKIVYTPLNGAGLIPVTQTLAANGFSQVSVVESQKEPNGNFPTCPYPNPETREALLEGLKLAGEKNADILVATDPDCDRTAIAVSDGKGDYTLISGNELGVLLLDYIAGCKTKNNTMPENPITIKTIVTTQMVDAVAKHYNVKVVDVLTGFKFIGEQICLLEEKGEQQRYIFGFEESCGYLAGIYARDKDAVGTSLLVCEMASVYKEQGITILDRLAQLYNQLGYYENSLQNFAFEGKAGFEKMTAIMDSLRATPPKAVAGEDVVMESDYLLQQTTTSQGDKATINLPKSNVLAFSLKDGSRAIVRPSGTEPKLKVYYSALGENFSLAQQKVKAMEQFFSDFITNF